MTHRDEPDDWDGPTPQVRVGDRVLRLPLRYSDSSCFAAVHPASYDAVAAALPASDLRPARWTDGRALVSVAAFRYRAVTTADTPAGLLAPYGEVSVAVLVTCGPAPRLLPALRRRLSMFVLHLPVTTREARDAGAALWGFPKFVADMDFAEERPGRRVTLAEGGTTVLELAVRGRGPVLTDRRPAAMYTTLGGQLMETVVPMAGRLRVAFGAGTGELRLGDHPVADSLRALEIAARPLAVFDYLDHHSVLPAGRPVGTGPAYTGHWGADRESGRFTVRYPHTPPLDLSAPVRVAT